MNKKRLLKAFWLYSQCLGQMEDALIRRSQAWDFQNKWQGVHFGILKRNDKYAKEYRRWARRAEIIEAWVDKNFEEASDGRE